MLTARTDETTSHAYTPSGQPAQATGGAGTTVTAGDVDEGASLRGPDGFVLDRP